MNYTEQDQLNDNTDWELMESISSTYGKKYSQLSKKQKKEVECSYMETMQDYNDKFNRIANRWYE